ncbi:hypothetical protein [Rheinheimera aquimaris]|uniref:hypothetical protein n=1 Tax=Rheinheimera aquimaris TaxID=412437 RepID=UPI001E46A38C|nr:hypothetical protein [Rheinheimera aquimaris]MCD1600477.1 hypothetical protein [Rheinheimera aquimaris]
MENATTMLYGFSLENLFKAIWTLNKFCSPHLKGWEYLAALPPELKTHDLVKLSAKVDPKIVNKYELSLSMLSDTSTWSGRYPCSLHGKERATIRWPKVNDYAKTIFKKYCKPFTTIS